VGFHEVSAYAHGGSHQAVPLQQVILGPGSKVWAHYRDSDSHPWTTCMWGSYCRCSLREHYWEAAPARWTSCLWRSPHSDKEKLQTHKNAPKCSSSKWNTRIGNTRIETHTSAVRTVSNPKGFLNPCTLTRNKTLMELSLYCLLIPKTELRHSPGS
jgi:hypothetical protein